MKRSVMVAALLTLFVFVNFEFASAEIQISGGSSEGTEETTQKAGDWEMHVGITRSWPKQEMANDYIHFIENELRPIAPEIKTFEDWDDVYTGSISIGIGKNCRMPVFGKIINAKPVLAYAYANGEITTRQSDLTTLYSVPMSYQFRQEYTFSRIEAGMEFDIFKSGPITGLIAGYLSYNWFESDTDLNTDLNVLGTQKVNGSFKERDIGYSTAFHLKYELPILTGWSLLGSCRYEWLILRDAAKINEIQHSPEGITSNSYKMPFEVDLSGPVLGMFLNKAF